MPDLLDSINKIYQLLHKDPDYQDTPTSTREEKIWGEATQRAKQHERNNIALSLAKASAVRDFTYFLSKAKSEFERPQARQLRTSFNPKQGSQQFLGPLQEPVKLDNITSSIGSVLPFFIEDLKTIQEGEGDKAQANFTKAARKIFMPSEDDDVDEDATRINISDAMTTLEQRMLLLHKFIQLEGFIRPDVDYDTALLISEAENHFITLNDDPEYAQPGAIEILLQPILDKLPDSQEGSAYEIIQEFRMAQAKIVSDLFGAFPLPSYEKWTGHLSADSPDALDKYSKLDLADQKGQLYQEEADGTRVRAGIAKASEGLLTPESTEYMGRVILKRWGTLEGAADDPIGRLFLKILGRSKVGQRMVIGLAAASMENPSQMMRVRALGENASARALKEAYDGLVRGSIDEGLKAAPKQAVGKVESKNLDFLSYLADEVEKMGGQTWDEDDFWEVDESTGTRFLIDPERIVPDRATLDRLTITWDQTDDIKKDLIDVRGEIAEGEDFDSPDWMEAMMAQTEGERENVRDEKGQSPNDRLIDDANNNDVVETMDTLMYRADWDEVEKANDMNGWLAEDEIKQQLIDSVNQVYDIAGVTEVFLYGKSVDDLRSNTEMAEDAGIKIGIRVNPRIVGQPGEIALEEIQNSMGGIFQDLPVTVEPTVFPAKGFSQEIYTKIDKEMGEHQKIVVFYEHDPISVEAGGTPTFPKAEDALMSQFEPILGTDLVGGHGSQLMQNINPDLLGGDFSKLMEATEGPRIAIEREDYRMPPLLAHKTVDIHPEIKAMRKHIEKFRGAKPINGIDGVGGIELDPDMAKTLNDSIFSTPGMVDSFFPRMPLLLKTMGDEIIDGLTANLNKTQTKAWKEALRANGNAKYDELYNKRREKIYTDIIALLPTTEKTKETLLETVPTLLYQLQTDRDRFGRKKGRTTEERRKLAANAFGYDGDGELLPDSDRELYTHEDLVRTFDLTPEAQEKLREKTMDKSLANEEISKMLEAGKIDPLIQTLMKPINPDSVGETWAYQLDMSVRQPSLADFHEQLNRRRDELVQEMTFQKFENVRQDIVFYDGEGQRIVLAVALPTNLSQLSTVEAEKLLGDKKYRGEELRWTLHRPEYAAKGELMRQPAKGGKAEQTALEKYLENQQTVMNADPEDRQELVDTHFDVVPDLGKVKALTDAQGVPYKRKEGEGLSLETLQNNGWNNPTFRQHLRSYGINLNEYPSFTNAPALTQTVTGMAGGLENLIKAVTRDKGTFDVAFDLARYRDTPEVITEAQREIRKQLLRQPLAVRDALISAWDTLVNTPEAYQGYGISLTREGSSPAHQMVSTLLTNLHAYETRAISRNEILPLLRTPTSEEQLQFERLIAEHNEHERQRPLTLDTTDDDFQAALKFIVGQYITDPNARMIYKEDLKRNAPHRTAFDATVGENVDVPLMDGESLQLVRLAFEKTFSFMGLKPWEEQHQNSLIKLFENGVNEDWELFNVFKIQYDNIMTEGDAATDRLMGKGRLNDLTPKIRVLSEADALAQVNAGGFDVPDENLSTQVKSHFKAQYVPLLKLATRLGHKSVAHMLISENVLLPEPEFILGSNNQRVENPEYRGGRGWIPLKRHDLRLFLHKTLANSHYAEDQGREEGLHFNGKHGQHFITPEFSIERAKGKGRQAHHKQRPTTYAVGLTAEGHPVIRILHDNAGEWDAPLKGVGRYQRDILDSSEANIALVGQTQINKETGEVEPKKNHANRGWNNIPRATTNRPPNSDDETVPQPTNAFLDFTQLNDLLKRHNIGYIEGLGAMQVPKLTNATDRNTVNAWIRETKQFFHVLQKIQLGRVQEGADLEGEPLFGEDQALFEEYKVTASGGGGVFEAISHAVSHITVGKGEKKTLSKVDFLSPHADQDGQNSKLEAFSTYKNTPLVNSATRLTQDRHEKHALRELQIAMSNTQLNDYPDRQGLKSLFGEHIHHHNKMEPLHLLVREMNKIKKRGQDVLKDDSTFDYTNNVNNEINLLLNNIWELVGPNHPDIRRWWEGEGHKTPEDVIDWMPDMHIEARESMKSKMIDRIEVLDKQLEGWRERNKAFTAQGGTRDEVHARLPAEAREEIKAVSAELDGLHKGIKTLTEIPWKDLLDGKVPKHLEEAFKTELATMPVPKPHFWQLGTKTKDYFKRRNKSEGSFPWALNGADTPQGLDRENRINAGLDPLGISGHGIRMVTGQLSGDGVLNERYANHFYIEFVGERREDQPRQILGHATRENDHFAIWRPGEVKEPGTHGWLGAAVNPHTGELYEPYSTNIKFEHLGEAIRNIEFVDPKKPDNNTGRVIATTNLAEEAGDVAAKRDHSANAHNFDSKALVLVEQHLSEEQVADIIEKNAAAVQLSFADFLQPEDALASTALAIITPTTLIVTKNDPKEDLPLEDYISDLADQNILSPPPTRLALPAPAGPEPETPPLPTRLEALRNHTKGEERLKSYLSTLNYINNGATAPGADRSLQHHGPLLSHLVTPAGEWNDENILALDAKFVELGFHSIINRDDPTKSAWGDTNTNPNYSGMQHFFQRIQAMATGNKIQLRGNENNSQPLAPEQKQAMFSIFNPEEGEPLIKDFHFQNATEINQEDVENTSAAQEIEDYNNAVLAAAREDVIEHYKHHGHGNLPSAFDDFTPEETEEALRTMEEDNEFLHNNKIKTLAPWKISKGTAALLAQSGFKVAPDIDAAIKKDNRNGEPLLTWKLTHKDYSWDKRLYLTVDDEDNPGKQKFNPDFLGISDENSEASDEEKEAQLSLLSQLVNENGQVKHLYNTDKKEHQVLTAWGENTLQNWNESNDDKIGPHPESGNIHIGKLPRILDSDSIDESLDRMKKGTFGESEEIRKANIGHYKTGKIQNRTELSQQQEHVVDPEGAGTPAGPAATETVAPPAATETPPAATETPPAATETPPIALPAPDSATPPVLTEEERQAAEAGTPITEIPSTAGADDGAKSAASTDADPKSAWDALSPDDQARLGTHNITADGYNRADDPTKGILLNLAPKEMTEDEREAAAVQAGQRRESEVDLDINPKLDEIMTKRFEDDWEKHQQGQEIDPGIQKFIDMTLQHYKDHPKLIESDYITNIMKPILSGEADKPKKASIEELTAQYKAVYSEWKTDVNNPDGMEPPSSAVPQDENLLLRGINDIQLKIRQGTELKKETRLREKANDLSDFDQLPQGISARMLKLKASEALLHEAKYKYGLDSKEKSFMTEESQLTMQQFWNDVLMREDDSGNKLINMETIFAAFQNEIKNSDNEDGIVAELDKDGNPTGKKVHFLDQQIKEEREKIKVLNARHEALAEKIGKEGTEALQYPVNGHNILVSLDGKKEIEMGEGGEFNIHEEGRLRDEYNGNLVDEDNNRLTKAPTVLGLKFAGEEDEQAFNDLWNQYYQNAHKINGSPPSLDKEALLAEEERLERKITQNYGKKGFKSDFFRQAHTVDSPLKPPSAGVDEEGKERPLPQVINPITGELEDGLYSPQLHAIINDSFYRTLLAESKKHNTNPLYADHKQLKLRGKDYGMEGDEESLQLIQPLENSPLLNEDKGAAVLFTNVGGLYHVPSAASYEIPEDGPMSHQEFREMTLMLQIADDMSKNPTAYSGDIANLLNFPEQLEAGDQESLVRSPTLRQQVRDSSSAKEVRQEHKQDRQASPTARFLASLGRYPKIVGEEVPVGRLLTALAGDLTSSLTGKRLIPITQSQKHTEALMGDYKRHADGTRQASELAAQSGMLDAPLPVDEKTGELHDPLAEYRPENLAEVESPFKTIGGAVRNLMGFTRREQEPVPEPSAQPPPSFLPQGEETF